MDIEGTDSGRLRWFGVASEGQVARSVAGCGHVRDRTILRRPSSAGGIRQKRCNVHDVFGIYITLHTSRHHLQWDLASIRQGPPLSSKHLEKFNSLKGFVKVFFFSKKKKKENITI